MGWLNTPGADVVGDVRARLPWLGDDWRSGISPGLRIIAPSLYIAIASALPALAFGQQLSQDTAGTLTVVHVLAATAITGIIQAILGGQPLLIVGVAEPIVIIYGFLYTFAEGRPDGLGTALFLPWAAWICVWTSLMLVVLALAGSCRLIDKFTRFSGELFGTLIAVLFIQVGIKGMIAEFSPAKGTTASPTATTSSPNTPTAAADPTWQLVNGLWGLILTFGLLASSMILLRARSWPFFRRGVRGFLADYGLALMLVAWTGLSFALKGAPPGADVPRRVQTPQTWEVTSSWTVAHQMAEVPGAYIAAALIPALIIAVLFFFDHNVSSQMAQQKEFGLTKPSAYHYDMLLLAAMTLLCGLLGLPPVNGVLPQAPMHTRTLADLRRLIREASARCTTKEVVGDKDTAKAAAASTEAADSRPAAAAATGLAQQGAVISPFAAANGLAVQQANGAVHDSSEQLPSSDARVVLEPGNGVGHAAAKQHHPGVQEQRVSGLLQSLLVAACLGATPAIRQIPTSLLWGIFAYMALESLPGNQFWERLLLLITDPKCRVRLLERSHATYLQAVPFRVIAWFTLLQLALLAGIWALVTWAGIAGILFPLPIMALVPIRQYVLPRLFPKQYLAELDLAEYEEAEPLPHELAQLEATSLGIAPPEHARGSGSRESRDDVDDQAPEFLARRTLVHRVSQSELHERILHGQGSLPLHDQSGHQAGSGQ